MISNRPLPDGAVTFLFSEIEGSTQLWERAPEAMSDALMAHARAGAGRIALARGEADVAITAPKEALTAFTAIGLPFEAALAHADLARAYRTDGAAKLADIEARTAVSELEGLGAVVPEELADRSP